MQVTYANGKVTIEIPATSEIIANAPRSATGKSRIVGSTHGFMKVPGLDGCSLNLSLITK